MNVYGFFTYHKGRNTRTIIAAKSVAEIARIMGTDATGRFRDGISQTENKTDIQTANILPGVLLVSCQGSKGWFYLPKDEDKIDAFRTACADRLTTASVAREQAWGFMAHHTTAGTPERIKALEAFETAIRAEADACTDYINSLTGK